VGDLPSFWTAPFGLLAGLFVVQRVARWLQVLITSGRGESTDSTPRPGLVPSLLTSVAHPTPWLVLVGGIWAIHSLIVYPVTPEWRWFVVGFVGGPSIVIPLFLWRFRQLRLRLAKQVGSPTSSVNRSSFPSKNRMLARTALFWGIPMFVFMCAMLWKYQALTVFTVFALAVICAAASFGFAAAFVATMEKKYGPFKD
jgi:hypothetical protein